MSGWKTWTAAGLMAAYGVAGIYLGLHDADAGVKMVLEAGGLVGIGHKIEKITGKTHEYQN